MTRFEKRRGTMTRHLLVYFTHVDDLFPNKKSTNPMNTNFALGVSHAKTSANGGGYVIEGMVGMQPLSVCALTQTV